MSNNYIYVEISDGNKQQIYLGHKLFRTFHQCQHTGDKFWKAAVLIYFR